MILNSFDNCKFEYFKFLLKEGKYTPSRPNFLAKLILFDKNNLNPFFLQNFFIFNISSK